MKKAETKITSVRVINDPAFSVVKIKRHPLPTKSKSNQNKVTFYSPSVSKSNNAFSLPVAIPEEGLKELEIPPKIKTKPLLNKSVKKHQTPKDKSQTTKILEKGREKDDSSENTTSEYVMKMSSDIRSIDEKLLKVERALSKKVDTASSSQKTQVTFAEDTNRESPEACKEYNAFDYVDNGNNYGDLSPSYDRNTYASELQKTIINPVKNLILSQQYPLDFDPKAAISAIRSELEEWRKVTKQKYPVATSSSITRNDASSYEIQSSHSEDYTVSQDVAEKDSSSLESRSTFQDRENRKELATMPDPKAVTFPLDYYLELEKNKNKAKISKELEAKEKRFQRTENLIKQISDLAAEAEEKVKACLNEKTSRPRPVLSPVSLHESDSSYTERLVETKFNEVTFKNSKGASPRYEQPSTVKSPWHSKVNYSSRKNGQETYSSTTTDAISSSGKHHKKVNQKKIDTTLDNTKHNCHHIPKSAGSNATNNKFIKQSFKERSSNETSQCSCCKGSKDVKDSTQKRAHHQENEGTHPNNDFEQTGAINCEKQFNDASVNTEPLSLRINAGMINVVSTVEDKNVKMNDCLNKLCQIQELPKVVIRPNFTKQVGPIIDIQTTKPPAQPSNVAVVECVHGGPLVMNKGNISNVKIANDEGVDISLPAVSPPAVHFRNSRDLKLLKVTKDLLGKLNFKDGVNVEKLKRSLTNLVLLLNQISPLHVANMRWSDLDTGSANESVETFFSNIDLVTEILENEIKKPTGRYCDYPECLIKAVDLLCGNIRSLFVIDESRKKGMKPSEMFGPGDVKRKVKKLIVRRTSNPPNSKKENTTHRPSSTTTNPEHVTDEAATQSSIWKEPSDLYIPYRLLIPGGKHKAMEKVKNSQDIQLRFKRLEKVLEINKNLTDQIKSAGDLQNDNTVQTHAEEEKSSRKSDHVLNETFVIESDNSLDDQKSEILQEKPKPKANKSDPDYEDDWEIYSSKSNDGSLAMTELKVDAQVHASQTSFAHSSPKSYSLSFESSSGSEVPIKGSQAENITSLPSFSSESQRSSIDKKEETTRRLKRPNSAKKKINPELKDVETQYKATKEDKATMCCEDSNISRQPKIGVIEPTAGTTDASSFTVLRMTNPSKNSQLEVRFPEHNGKFQSSLRVQKTDNSEEINLVYNMNKDELCHLESNKNSISPQIATVKESTKSDIMDKHLTNSSDDQPLITNIEDLNDFQKITKEFIQYLGSKVNEIADKFKLSEEACENFLDQKLTGNTDYKAPQRSVHNFHISSSKASLKNELFYKSASSIFSNLSNEEAPMIQNSSSQRCTPDNQEISTFQNLTSPPVGLQFKESSALNNLTNIKEVASSAQNKINSTLAGNPRSGSLFGNTSSLEQVNQHLIGQGESLHTLPNQSTFSNVGNEISEKMSYMKSDEDQNRKTLHNGFQNRLLPLPGDIIGSRITEESKEETKSETLTQENSILKGSSNVLNSRDDVILDKGVVERSSLQIKEISHSISSSFEETIMALMSVEESFEKNEDSTVLVAKKSNCSIKNQDDIDSQATSVNFVNILSASESGRISCAPSTSKPPSPSPSPGLNENTPTDVITSSRQNRTSSLLNPISVDRDVSKLLPAPEAIGQELFHLDQSMKKCSDIMSDLAANVNVHTLFVSGPSHVDSCLDSQDTISNNTMENMKKIMADSSAHVSFLKYASIQTTSCVSVSNSSQISPASFEDAVIQTNIRETLDHASQTSPPSDAVILAISKATCDSSPQVLPALDEALKLSDDVPNANSPVKEPNNEDGSEASNLEELSGPSDISMQINYYNPEEMSDGEVGYVYTSNSYSSGEIKPCDDLNEDDSLSGPPTFREVTQNLSLQGSSDTLKPNNLVTDKVLAGSSCTETDTSALRKHYQKVMASSQSKSEKSPEHDPDGEISSNDSTSTAELKNLFNSEDKIDDGLLGKLIDLHIRCSTSFSSESPPHEIIENTDEN